MHRPPVRSLALGLVSFLWSGLVAASAQGPTPVPTGNARIAWESDFDVAMQRAQKEKKPIFVAFLMDDEPANDETIQKHYTDPEVVKLTSRCVCLACCTGDHKCEEGHCTKFPGTTCAQHQAIEKRARSRWLTGDEVCTPQHVFCDPSGQVIVRKVYLIPKETLRKCLAVALDAVAKDPEAKSIVDAEKAAVDRWLKDIDSRNLETREAAMRELVVAEDPRAMPAVIRLARSGSDDTVRLGAINALAKKGNLAAAKPLAAMLGDSKAQILIAVARSLETIQLPDATSDLITAIRKEKRDRVRGFLLRAAARSAPKSAVVRDACLQVLKGASAQLEPCVLLALGRMAPDAKIVDAVKSRLGDKNQNVRGLAVWVLGSQRTPECAKALQALLDTERTPEVTTIARSALELCRGAKVENWETRYSTFFSDADYQ